MGACHCRFLRGLITSSPDGGGGRKGSKRGRGRGEGVREGKWKGVVVREGKCTALWARITKNTNWSTGPLARSFVHSLTPLTFSLATHYLFHSRAPLRLLACSLAHFAHSLARGKVNVRMVIYLVFFGQRPRRGRCPLE